VQLSKNSIIFGFTSRNPPNYFLLVNRYTYQAGKNRLSYLRFGQGPDLVVCFHGYGEEGLSFSFLDTYAGDSHSFISIDLPFHGLTDWDPADAPDAAGFLAAVNGIVDKEFGPQQRFTLMGFSLGGRIALSLYQAGWQRITKLILLAPDGLKVNRWYWFATQTKVGNRLFHFTMKHPGWFFGLLKLMNRLRLVNASIFKFVKYYIGDEKVRQQLYTRWTVLRKLKPGIPVIKEQIRKQQTPVRLLYGMHDRIILSSVGEKFRSGIETYCTISMLHAGHQVLHEKHAGEILPALQ